jgi:hypothetical protein
MKGVSNTERFLLEEMKRGSGRCGGQARKYTIEEIELVREMIKRGLVTCFDCPDGPHQHTAATKLADEALSLQDASEPTPG